MSADPDSNSVLVYLRWDGPSFSAVEAPHAIGEEAHRLLLQVGDDWVLLRGCTCEVCRARAGAERGPLPLDEAAAQLARLETAQGRVTAVNIVLGQDMVERLADGSETAAETIAVALRDALHAHGVASRLLLSVPEEARLVGTWLRVIADDTRWGLDHLLVQGMLGQVIPDDYRICTPGVSVMTQIAGRGEPFGYPWDALEVLDHEPTPDELAAARQLTASAGDALQARHGWLGVITVGGKAMPEARVTQDITRLVAKLSELATAGRTTDHVGHAKRLAKLLRAYALHPRGAELATLAQAVSAHAAGPLDEATRVGIAAALTPATPAEDAS